VVYAALLRIVREATQADTSVVVRADCRDVAGTEIRVGITKGHMM
jgi:hypothetical protein